MAEVPELRVDGEVHPIDLLDLDEEIRQGRLPRDVELRYGPWTGEAFQRLGDIPALAEALDSPNAAFAEHLRAAPFPWASTAVTLIVLAAGLLLELTKLFGGHWPEASAWLLDAYGGSATGLEALVLDGRWWSAWGWQLVHAGPGHLLPNLVVLGYAGFRVERALGAWGYAFVVAASVLLGTLAVTLFQPVPVMGSSTMGFGVWGAQLAIGFRMGQTIPPALRRRYGYGNLLLFIVLFANSLAGSGVSHYAHVGGFIGGVLAAMSVTPPFMRPAAARPAVRRRLGLALAALGLAPFTVGWALRAAPALTFGLPVRVELPEEGVSLEVRSRLLRPGLGIPGEEPYTSSVRGMPAWSTSRGSQLRAFVGIDELSWAAVEGGDPLTGGALEASWTRLAGGAAEAVTPPPPRAPGWTSHALQFRDPEGVARYRLVEHHLLRGRYLLRAGWYVSLDGRVQPDPREALFEEMIASIEVGDPPRLAAARADHARNPTSPRIRRELAKALWDLGDFEQADALYALAAEAGGRPGLEAAVERLSMWNAHPALFSEAPVPTWFEPWLEEHPTERSLQVEGITWLARAGRCLAARAHHEAFANARPDAAELVSTAEAVLRCEGALE
ncbi:MAG: rhomboid family intramembrane serine protease [Alphaproteobacteria bacterium]|nr:rhomboid family intramembrane serine protease [Alphaproteobacteria bacterium]MCB9793886.1 rhomboid family intramembrane serine protease [Alphaproteobacteria bacterium]